MRNLVSFVLVMVKMGDMKGEKIKKEKTETPKRRVQKKEGGIGMIFL